MWARMKKRTTGRSVEITLSLPARAADQMTNIIINSWKMAGHSLYVSDEDYGDSIPVEVIFPTHSPGEMLRGVRGREGITQQEMADKLGLSRYCVAEMEHNRRPITPEMARKISKTFDISERIFLD